MQWSDDTESHVVWPTHNWFQIKMNFKVVINCLIVHTVIPIWCDCILRDWYFLPSSVTACVLFIPYSFLSFPPTPSLDLQSLVSAKCYVGPKSRGGLCAWWLPLRGVSCLGHSSTAWLPSPAAKNGLAGTACNQLGYWVTHTRTHTSLHISPPVSCSVREDLRSRCFRLGVLMIRDNC